MGKSANDDDTDVVTMAVERNDRRDISVADDDVSVAAVDVVSCRTVVDDEDVDTDRRV